MEVRGAPTHPVKPAFDRGTIGWHNVSVVAPGGIAQQHCVPVNDIRPHMLGETCDCKPQEDYGHPDYYVHFAWDRREDFYENGRKMS